MQAPRLATRAQMQRSRLSSWQTCCRSFKGYENALSVIPRALLLLYGCRIENRKKHPRKSRVVFYLSHCSVSSHERGQLLNPLQRERRERHRLHGDGHQLHRVIVSRCAVGMQYTAAPAAMNHCHSPFLRTQTPMASIMPPQSAARSPGSSSTCRLDRQFGQ